MAHEHGLILPGSGLDLAQPATHARRPHGLFSKLWAPWVTESITAPNLWGYQSGTKILGTRSTAHIPPWHESH